MKINCENYEILQGVVEFTRPEDLIKRIQATGLQYHCCIICIDAERVAGREHVESAVRHAIRAWCERKAIADSLEMEVLLYTGGTRQTGVARTFGVNPETKRLYLCFIPPNERAVAEIGRWVQYNEDCWEEMAEEKIRRLMDLFGVTPAECAAIGIDHIKSLVIERVALLDVYK
jgi:KEOPS complex subunit Cgi121